MLHQRKKNMKYDGKNNYIPLSDPGLITEQKWDKTALPKVNISSITYNHKNFIPVLIEGFIGFSYKKKFFNSESL